VKPPDARSNSTRLGWAVAALAGLSALVIGAGIVLQWRLPVPPCTFKTITGWPCPTCGSTRALAALGSFDFTRAAQLNPLMTLLFLGLLGWSGIALWEVIARRRILSRIRFEFAAWKIILFVLAALMLNWIYVLFTLPR
jgi:hypothetical protein